MSSVFTILFLVSLILLAWGLIAPRHFAKYAKNKTFTRKHAGLGFGCLAVVFLILVGATAPTSKPAANLNPSTKSQTQPQQASAGVNTNSLTTKQVIETQSVAFTTQNQDDGNLPQGQTKVIQVGEDGVKTLTFKVTYSNGQETGRALISTAVTTSPINQIVAVGTYVASTPAPPSTPSPSPAPAASSCYPLTNGGNCYEPGEYCRNSDHGATGKAGNGESIVCTDNNGWRWEPR